VKERGGIVVADSPEVLAKLLATCPGVDQVIPRGQGLPKFDTYIQLMSLPGLFGIPPDARMAAPPYLTPPSDRVEFWRAELAGIDRLRVGIVWQGSKSHRGDRIRSVPLTQFAPLAAVPGVRLISLQKGAGIEQLEDPSASDMNVLDLGKRTAAGMEDTAALLANLDLLVSIDTSVAHLAGVLAKPAWVALPSAPDWRWLREREDTPWYPTMRLFRQRKAGGWDDVFGCLREALAELTRTSK
jgi:hypothetical protein